MKSFKKIRNGIEIVILMAKDKNNLFFFKLFNEFYTLEQFTLGLDKSRFPSKNDAIIQSNPPTWMMQSH